jgi:Adenosylmethionine decarboxylase
VQDLLEHAAALGLRPQAAKYSRASFLFPEDQPPLYQSFDSEAAFLRSALGDLGKRGVARVLGDASCGLQWHVFTASAAQPCAGWSGSGGGQSSDSTCTSMLQPGMARDGDSTAASDMEGGTALDDAGACDGVEQRESAAPAVQTLEVCMTELSRASASQFVRTEAFVSSAHTTEATGVRALAPSALIDDYLFEPCGCDPANAT